MPPKKKEPENSLKITPEFFSEYKIGDTRQKRFKEYGVEYYHDICMLSPQDLVRISNLELPKAETFWMDARRKLDEMGVVRPIEMTAMELYKYKKELPTLPSGSEAIDILFGGKGPKCETLTEVYGQFGSGKTQYLMSCMVEVMNMGHNVLIIDCEDTFDPERLLDIAVSRGYITDSEEDAVNFLSKLDTKTATNSTEVKDVLNHLSGLLLDRDIKLVAVDGAIGLFRKDFHGRGELSVRQDYLKELMARLGGIPMFFKCWVMITNQVQADPGVFFGDPTKPIGGNVVGHQATFRAYFKNLSKTKWQATMVDSPHHAKLDVKFQLTRKGVDDIPEELTKLKKTLKGEIEPETTEE